MPKKIKFPLEMADGYLARNLEGLQDYFHAEKVVSYFLSGKLKKWLVERYYDEKAKSVNALATKDPEFMHELCSILEVNQQFADNFSMVDYEKKLKKIDYIKANTENTELVKEFERVAISQEELEKIISRGHREVYLLGDDFQITVDQENMEYLGVNDPIVRLSDEKDLDFDELSIVFDSVTMIASKPIRVKASKSRNLQKIGDNILMGNGYEFAKYHFPIKKHVNDYEDKQYLLYGEKLIVSGFGEVIVVDMACGVIEAKLSNDEIFDAKSIDYPETKALNELFKLNKNLFRNSSESFEIISNCVYDDKLIMLWVRGASAPRTTVCSYDFKSKKLKVIGELNNIGLSMLDVVKMQVKKGVLSIYRGIDNTNYFSLKGIYRYKYPSLENIDRKSSYNTKAYTKLYCHTDIYDDETYMFNPNTYEIDATLDNYMCDGFFKDDFMNMGSIGKFRIKDDAIIASAGFNYTSQVIDKDSVLAKGELALFTRYGGAPFKKIRAFKSSVADILLDQSNVIAWSKEEAMIKVFDQKGLDLVGEIPVNEVAKTRNKKQDISHVEVDNINHRLLIVNNGVAFVVE